MASLDHPSPALLDDRDPWDRWGWVMATVWLVFLVYPILAAFTSDLSPAGTAAAVAAIVAFASVYIAAFRRLGHLDTAEAAHRLGWLTLVPLVSLVVAVGLLVGLEALGMAPFLVSWGNFSLRGRDALLVALTTLGATVAVPLVAGVPEAALGFGSIVGAVAGGTGIVRVLETRTLERRAHEQEMALAGERDRVARDVHDVLGHSLTAVTVKAELAERLVEVDPDRARAELKEILELSRQSLAEIRATVAGLRVAGLTEELETARRTLAGAGIAAALPDDVTAVDPRHRTVLGWALREAVTNVVRHSGAQQCRVELGSERLLVVDDGRGTHGSREGNGLRGLRERVAAAGGSVEVRPGDAGRGTEVEVRW